MDLDDSFTEKLLQRSKARREYLNVKKTENPNVSSKKRTVSSEEQPVTNQGAGNNVKDDSPKRQRLSFPSEDNEDEKENVHMEEDNVEEPLVSFKATSNIRGLAALKKNHDRDTKNDCNIASEAACDPEVNKCRTYVFSTNSSELCSTRKTRLANLAAHINQWEDDLDHPSRATNNVTSSSVSKKSSVPSTHSLPSASSLDCFGSNSSAKKLCNSDKASSYSVSKPHTSLNQIISETGHDEFHREICNSELGFSCMPPVVMKGNIESGGGSNKSTKGLGIWNQAIKAALGNESMVKASSKPVNSARCEESESGSSEEESEKEETVNEDSHSKRKEEKFPQNFKNEIKSKNSSVLNKSIDPAELPLSARKALFEKALLGGNVKSNEPEPKLSVAQRAAIFENGPKNPKAPANFAAQKQFVAPSSSPTKLPKAVNVELSPSKNVTFQKNEKIAVSKMQSTGDVKGSPVKKIAVASNSPLSPNKNIGLHTRQVQQNLVKCATNTWQQREIATKAAGERKKEISNLVNHWEKLSSSSSLGNNDSEEEHSVKQTNNPDDNLYESEEDHSVYDSESEPEHSETEPGWKEKPDENSKDLSQSESDDSDAEQEVFNPISYSTEAELSNFDIKTDYESASNSEQYWQPKDRCTTRSADSVSLQSSTSETSSYNVFKSQSVSSSSSTGSYERGYSTERAEATANSSSDTPLQYTVSFYRKQKQEIKTPPVRTIVRREQVLTPQEEDDQTQIIQERIKLLQEEILRHQTVISQASQALNLCHATAEFYGSSEQVEGEKLLFIATQKRQACLNEIQRLKSHSSQREIIADGTGTLTITDIQLPLKREFIAAQLEGKINDDIHYFLCLIRHGPQVIVSQMVSTSDKISDGALCFTNHIKLQNLPADFSVVFEVYALQTKKENLTHEKKYHIKREQSKNRLTPKGKKSEGKFLHPAVSSPGGPHAVRSSSFSLIGYTRFTLQNHNKRCITLDKVPFTSPLDGVLKVSLHLHAEHKIMEKGFLTMFEDVSGFGAWHRRWCSLNSQQLAYWKYPDDEQKKQPIGVIDLKQCRTGEVKLVARDICARPHTFQLLIVRPHSKGDKNTLISRSVDTLTTTKHLISADTKEERIIWCNKLNEALTNLRKWNPRALRPVGDQEE